MDDQEFLLYCEMHCLTERAAFVPQQLARLYRLAGNKEMAAEWDSVPNRIVDGARDVVKRLVREARSNPDNLGGLP